MTEALTELGILREIKDSELELMLSWRNQPAVRENMYNTHQISLAEHLSWWGNIKGSELHRYFMYEFQGKPLGIVGFIGIDCSNQNSSWAFYAAPDAPKGTGGRMEVLALEYAFNELKLHKLCCEVLAFNTPVIKMHEKFGFKIEGTLRDQYHRDRRFFHIYRLGLLASEWSGLRADIINKIRRISKRLL